ncbi:MAG: hypothetical protein EOP06_05040, partial [Proteobacteria bacterium]
MKLRQAVPATVAHFKTDADCFNFRGHIRCEPPNSSFERFVGMLYLDPPAQHPSVAEAEQDGAAAAAGSTAEGAHVVRNLFNQHAGSAGAAPEQQGYSLEAETILLRGSVVRNVDYAYAMVVYTGRETKVRVKQMTRIMKRAQVETEINRFTVILVALLLVFCVCGAVLSAVWRHQHVEDHTYMRIERAGVLDSIRQLFTYFLLNAAFIPVSLYVTVRLARSFQMFFMEKDREMFHSDPDLMRATNGLEGQYPFKVRTMDLNDELGQISHMFSDKTGTLTLNYMEFRKLLVNGVSYGLGTTQIGVDRLRREGADVSHLEEQLAAEKARVRGPDSIPHVNFEDGSESHPGRLLRHDQAHPRDNGQGTAIHQFMCHLTLNHTVLQEVVRCDVLEFVREHA